LLSTIQDFQLDFETISVLLPLTVVDLHLTSWNDKTCLRFSQCISLKRPNMPRQQSSCPNTKCQLYGQSGKGNIIRYGFFGLKRGKRRRYRCKTCGQTFCSTSGTVYHRIHRSRNTFDEVCSLSVEGLSKSAIARVKKLSWNTVSRWLERAAQAAEQFSKRRLRGFVLQELQLDEIRTFLDRKKRPIWIITVIEVWSRLWPSCVLGRRSYTLLGPLKN
jgi:transposase-like protein